MRNRTFKIILAMFVLAVFFSNGKAYAETYLVPLNVAGSYDFLQTAAFTIDLGTEFAQINEVRF